jgi:hypothetical protein
MSNEPKNSRRDEDAEIEREIRRGRKFSLEEAIAELAGPGGMKGASPVTGLEQAAAEIENWLKSHLVDPGGALTIVLHRAVKGSEPLLKGFHSPLVVLADFCRRVLSADSLLAELVRHADVEWGRIMCERPMFERAGRPADPGDPYTMDSVRRQLAGIVRELETSCGETRL